MNPVFTVIEIMFLLFEIILETLASQPMRTVQHNVMLWCCIYIVSKNNILDWFLITSCLKQYLVNPILYRLCIFRTKYTISFQGNEWRYFMIITVKTVRDLFNTVYIFHSIWLVCCDCVCFDYTSCVLERIFLLLKNSDTYHQIYCSE